MYNSIALLLLCLCLWADATNPSQQYVIGIDAGTESVRVGLFDATPNSKYRLISSSATPYETYYPHPGWAEQNPEEWWIGLSQACLSVLDKAKAQGVKPSDVLALCVDSTACSVLALDENKQPLRRCLLWMDARSASQADHIMRVGKGDKSLEVNCGGSGPMSAEWMLPKALWLKMMEPDVWRRAEYVCEKQDWLNLRLTGRLVCSGCNVAARWHWDCLKTRCHFSAAAHTSSEDADSIDNDNDEEKRWIGRPVSLLRKVGLDDLLQKWPREVVAMGEVVGALTADAADFLGGLSAGIPVIQGGPDAYVGMVGLGCLSRGKLGLITGSSHLHLAVGDNPSTGGSNDSCSTQGSGFWGVYKDAPLQGLCFAEGGQSSTGSMLSWFRRLLSSPLAPVSYAELDSEAAGIPPGSLGLLCQETFQGSRTPTTDPRARGALVGLSLAHSRAHVWRALLEGVCLGTRACIEALKEGGGFEGREILIGGGAARSAFFLQLHADITGLPVAVSELADCAPLLGAAVLAAAGAGVYDTESDSDAEKDGIHNSTIDSELPTLKRVRRAMRAMVRVSHRVYPDPFAVREYNKVFAVYQKLAQAVQSTSHALVDLALSSPSSSPSSSSPTNIAGDASDDRLQAQPPSCAPTASPTAAPTQIQPNDFFSQFKRQMKGMGEGTASSKSNRAGKTGGQKSSSLAAQQKNRHTTDQQEQKQDQYQREVGRRKATVAPSILSADFGCLSAEAALCRSAGVKWLHVDVCDGGDAAPGALTLGPQAVAALRRACPELSLDAHVVAGRPGLLIRPLALAGASRITLQYEQLAEAAQNVAGGAVAVIEAMCRAVRATGAACGLCLSPETSASAALLPLSHLLEGSDPVIEFVNILAVNPGFGGQPFDDRVLEKLEWVRNYFPGLPHIGIDGGVDIVRCEQASKRGANFFVAGTSVFGRNRIHGEGDGEVYRAIKALTSVSLKPE